MQLVMLVNAWRCLSPRRLEARGWRYRRTPMPVFMLPWTTDAPMRWAFWKSDKIPGATTKMRREGEGEVQTDC